jgi:hypothetical protein
MSQTRDAFVFALDECLNRLEALVGAEPQVTSAEESAKFVASLDDANFRAKTRVRHAVASQRGRLRQLEEHGWPPFRPEDAQTSVDLVERVIHEARANTLDGVFHEAAARAMTPLREVIETYALRDDGIWKFKEEDCDPIPEWNPSPAAET